MVVAVRSTNRTILYTMAQSSSMKARLYIGGLSDKITDQDVQELAKKIGPVQNIHLPKSVVPQLPKHFAIVTLQSFDEKGSLIIKKLNGSHWKGCFLRIEFAKEYYADRLQREKLEEAVAVKENIHPVLSSGQAPDSIENSISSPLLKIRKKRCSPKVTVNPQPVIRIANKYYQSFSPPTTTTDAAAAAVPSSRDNLLCYPCSKKVYFDDQVIQRIKEEYTPVPPPPQAPIRKTQPLMKKSKNEKKRDKLMKKAALATVTGSGEDTTTALKTKGVRRGFGTLLANEEEEDAKKSQQQQQSNSIKKRRCLDDNEDEYQSWLGEGKGDGGAEMDGVVDGQGELAATITDKELIAERMKMLSLMQSLLGHGSGVSSIVNRNSNVSEAVQQTVVAAQSDKRDGKGKEIDSTTKDKRREERKEERKEEREEVEVEEEVGGILIKRLIVKKKSKEDDIKLQEGEEKKQAKREQKKLAAAAAAAAAEAMRVVEEAKVEVANAASLSDKADQKEDKHQPQPASLTLTMTMEDPGKDKEEVEDDEVEDYDEVIIIEAPSLPNKLDKEEEAVDEMEVIQMDEEGMMEGDQLLVPSLTEEEKKELHEEEQLVKEEGEAGDEEEAGEEMAMGYAKMNTLKSIFHSADGGGFWWDDSQTFHGQRVISQATEVRGQGDFIDDLLFKEAERYGLDVRTSFTVVPSSSADETVKDNANKAVAVENIADINRKAMIFNFFGGSNEPTDKIVGQSNAEIAVDDNMLAAAELEMEVYYDMNIEEIVQTAKLFCREKSLNELKDDFNAYKSYLAETMKKKAKVNLKYAKATQKVSRQQHHPQKSFKQKHGNNNDRYQKKRPQDKSAHRNKEKQ